MSSAKNKNKHIVFVSLELSKLLEDSSDLKSLRQKCLDSDPSVATSALHALTCLVEREKLTIVQGLSTLISLVSTDTSVPPGLVPAIGRLLILESSSSSSSWQCCYNINDRPHPLVTILRHSWDTWDGVATFLIELFGEHTQMEERKKLDLVRPVISLIFIDPRAPKAAKIATLQLLIHNKHLPFLLKILAWQEVDFNWCSLLHELLFMLLNISQTERKDSIEALTPFLAGAVGWLVPRGYDPKPWIYLLNSCLHETLFSDDIVLILMAQIIPTCPTPYLNDVVQFCNSIIKKKKCNVYCASTVAATILSWALIPSGLTSQITKQCHQILAAVRSLPTTSKTAELFNNQLFCIFRNSRSEVSIACEIAMLSNTWRDNVELLKWLNFIGAQKNIFDGLKFLLLGVILQSRSMQIVGCVNKCLVKSCKEDERLAFPALGVLLHKLSVEKDPKLQLEFLRMVPEMSVDKDTVPLVLGTIQSLLALDNEVMRSLSLSLLLILWHHQPRTFPHLHRLLQSTPSVQQHSWKYQVALANTLLEICRKKPETHGKDLLGLLSGVLNARDGASDASAVALAVDAITELCKANVIHIRGTWEVTKHKMQTETRPAVAAAVCRLLSEASQDEDFAPTAIARLWRFQQSNIAAADAFAALGKFPLEAFEFKSLPEIYRKDLVIPRTLVTTDEKQSPEDIFSYVPGECWVQLLEKVDDSLLNAAEHMVQGLVKAEIDGLPRGLYALPLGSEEPRSLAHLPPQSLLRAFIEYLQKHTRGELVVTRVFVSLLRLLSLDYLRPLPPLNWSFIRPAFADQQCKSYVITICARPGTKSPSALDLMEENLKLMNVKEIENATILLQVLPNLAQSIPATVLMPTITEALRLVMVDIRLFTEAVNLIRKTIALASVTESNRTGLAQAIKDLLVDLSSDLEELDVLWQCVSELPKTVLSKILTPTYWSSATSRKLNQVLRVRRILALSTVNGCPLDEFTEFIGSASFEEENQKAVLRELFLILKNTSSDICSGWFIRMLGRLLDSTRGDEPIQKCLFLLEIFVISSVVLSGCHQLLEDSATLVEDRSTQLRLFPLSLHSLFQSERPGWKDNCSSVLLKLHRLWNWKELSAQQRYSIEQGLISLRSHAYSDTSPQWLRVFYLCNNPS